MLRPLCVSKSWVWMCCSIVHAVSQRVLFSSCLGVMASSMSGFSHAEVQSSPAKGVVEFVDDDTPGKRLRSMSRSSSRVGSSNVLKRPAASAGTSQVASLRSPVKCRGSSRPASFDESVQRIGVAPSFWKCHHCSHEYASETSQGVCVTCGDFVWPVFEDAGHVAFVEVVKWLSRRPDGDAAVDESSRR